MEGLPKLPTPRLVTISAWSYSRYSTYLQCPAKAKYSYIDKIKEPDSAAGMKGTRVHALAALIATGRLPTPDKDNRAFFDELKAVLKSKNLPDELSTFKEEFKALKKERVITEADWAFDKNWEPTGWFASNAWLRVKVDAHFLTTTKKNGGLRETAVEIIDHKTGKKYEEHGQQRSLYALAAFLYYPDVTTVTAAHWYLDAGTEDKDTWNRSQLGALQEEWVKRTTAMLSDTTFAPRPSDKCRWCHFRKANDGPCIF
jgi:RecB family exonuclease